MVGLYYSKVVVIFIPVRAWFINCNIEFSYKEWSFSKVLLASELQILLWVRAARAKKSLKLDYSKLVAWVLPSIILVIYFGKLLQIYLTF